MSEVEFPAKQNLASPIELAGTVIAAVMVAMVLLMIGVGVGVRGTDLALLATALVTLLTCVIPLLLGRGQAVQNRHILLSLWSLAMGIYFAVPIYTQYFLVTEPVDGLTRLRNIDPSDILTGQFVVLFAIAVTYIGYFYPVSRFAAQLLPRPRVEWPMQSALMIAIVMIPTGWFISLAGRFGLIPKSLGTGAIGVLGVFAYLGLGLMSILIMRYRSRPAILLAVLFAIPTMLLGFLTGSKRATLSPLMFLGLGYYVSVRRLSARWILVGAVMLITLYPIAQFYRESVLAGFRLSLADVVMNPGRAIALLSAFLSNVNPIEYIQYGIQASSGRLDTLGIVSVIVRDTPDKVPFQGGWTIGYVFISFIPRVIWPGKPTVSIGQWITDTYGSEGYVRSHTGSSWIGELYMNFGLVGVGVGMLLIGLYFRVLHETLFRSMTVPALFACVIILWATCTTIEMNLTAPVTGTIFHLAPVVMAHLAVRMFGLGSGRMPPQVASTFGTAPVPNGPGRPEPPAEPAGGP